MDINNNRDKFLLWLGYFLIYLLVQLIFRHEYQAGI
jgi:hypothetical protein